MKRFTLDFHLLILIWISSEFYFKFSDSFEWKKIPNPITHAKIDSPLQVYWEYNLSTNEELYEIEFLKNGQEMYSKMSFGGPFRKYSRNPKFRLTGDRLVTYSNSNISSGDEGIYCLKIEYTLKGHTDDDSIREKKNCTVLQPFALPYITIITSNLTMRQGKSTTLQCNASGLPKPSIIWKKVQSGLKNTTVTYKSQFWLNITGKMSGGKYCCQVSNRYGKDTKCSYIKVTALPHITNITSNLTMKQGESTTLQCNASGLPKPSIIWKKVQSNLKNTTVAYKSQFWLNITGKMSGGKYCCQVSNRYGKDTKCSYIKVTEYQPIGTVFTSRQDYIVKNTTFQVSCKADASPRARYLIKDGGKIVGNSTCETFNITTQNEENFINISCTAGNEYGKGDTKYLLLPVYDDRNLGSANNELAIMVPVVVCVLVIVIMVLVCILVSMKNRISKRQIIRGQDQNSRNQYIDESPYGDPVDAIQVKYPNYTSASNADYATVEETGYKRRSDVNRLPKVEVQNTTYATVENPKDKKKLKVEALYAKVNKNCDNKDKISDMPLVTLPEGISDNSSKTTNVSDNIPSPLPSPSELGYKICPHEHASDVGNSEEAGMVGSGQGSWFS